MAALPGRTLLLTVSPTAGGAGVYTTVAGIESCSIELDGQNVDVTTLTDADIVRIQAIKDSKVSLSGNFETDTNGQGAIRLALESNSTLWIKILPNGTAGWKFECKVAKYAITGSTKDKLSVSIDIEGSGLKTAI